MGYGVFPAAATRSLFILVGPACWSGRKSTQEKNALLQMCHFLVADLQQEKRTPPHSHLGGILRVSCWCVPRWYLGWYPDYTWPCLGIIQGPVSYASILPYLAAYPATYPGVSWEYIQHIFKLDVGA